MKTDNKKEIYQITDTQTKQTIEVDPQTFSMFQARLIAGTNVTITEGYLQKNPSIKTITISVPGGGTGGMATDMTNENIPTSGASTDNLVLVKVKDGETFTRVWEDITQTDAYKARASVTLGNLEPLGTSVINNLDMQNISAQSYSKTFTGIDKTSIKSLIESAQTYASGLVVQLGTSILKVIGGDYLQNESGVAITGYTWETKQTIPLGVDILPTDTVLSIELVVEYTFTPLGRSVAQRKYLYNLEKLSMLPTTTDNFIPVDGGLIDTTGVTTDIKTPSIALDAMATGVGTSSITIHSDFITPEGATVLIREVNIKKAPVLPTLKNEKETAKFAFLKLFARKGKK